jgi:hypothetical protein
MVYQIPFYKKNITFVFDNSFFSMKIFDSTTVLEELNKHQTAEKWVNSARENSRVLKALVTGDGFHEELISKIEHLESDQRSTARRKYSKDIRDLFFRVTKKRDNVFQATGGSEEIKIEGETYKTQFIDTLEKFKGGKSINKYLSENYFRQLDTDPNGVIFIEYKTEKGEGEKLEIYPTYKSINHIRFYESDGQKCEYIIFEPVKKVVGNGIVIYWRVVDSKTDWSIKQVGNLFVIDTEKTFEHPFGECPAVILSDFIKVGHKDRLSPLTPIVELAKDYARDKSILTIYKFQNGFPKHWQYVTQCRYCHGTGKTGQQKTVCSGCSGTGILTRKDVTDSINLSTPKENDPIIAPNIAGFIQPDLATWKQYKEDLKDAEGVIERTLWGTMEVNGTNETATGRFIDVQPITNELNRLTDTVEWIHNTIANWVANAIVPTKKKEVIAFHKSYGRRFIIESPDIILERYETSRKAGENTTVLDKLLQEFILSKYKTDPFMQEQMLKKASVEPYIHYTIEQINSIFGKKEAYKKAVFGDFWLNVDQTKTVDVINSEFVVYFNKMATENSMIIQAPSI